jgi:glycosyltransferase involved in cell wall biosynthesis
VHSTIQVTRPARSRKRIAHVSTFPPLRCGIASFVSDLISATPNFEHIRYALHYGDTGSAEEPAHADVNSVDKLAKLAQLISASDCDIVSLQHEFGIWGGREGENIHAFLDNLTKPVLSVLHTTFGPGVRSRIQSDILLRLIAQSARVVVLTDASKATAETLSGERIEHMLVVPHGIPDFPYVAPPDGWVMDERKCASTIRLITPGFFREDKGLETVLYALRDLRDRGYTVSYRIAGEPQHQFGGQALYRARVEGLIELLGLGSVVQIDGRYFSVAEQAAYIQQAHLGIFGYQDPSHASSGTVPLVMSMGRPVLCTPFEYAKAKAQEGPGVFLTNGFDPNSIADGIERFMRIDEYATLAEATYDRTRLWTWPAIGKTFGELYLACG